MDRKQKKTIRLKITQLLDDHCRGCEFRSVYKSHDYCNQYCLIGKELTTCSTMLLDKPVVKKSAEENIGTMCSYRWTIEEEFYLINHASIFTINHLAKRLNRSYGAVHNKLCRLKKEKKVLFVKRKREVDAYGLPS
ncbi:MAG: zinc-finger domain-containing protein [Bacillus sp. (in: Bacteria)]|nr:zinc-finger domain-containing protein [Bacillus sp. (in: firmicutes)]